MRGRTPTIVSVLIAASVVCTAAYAAWLLTGQPSAFDTASTWAYNGSVALFGAACLVQGSRFPTLAWAWRAFGVGLIAWAAGDVYYTEVLEDLRRIPYPSWADVGYLIAVPCFFVGIGLLIRHRIGRFTAASWFDGAIGALAVAGFGAALLSPALVGLTDGDPATVLTNLAYPLGDLILLSFLTGAIVVTGARGANSILAVSLGLLVWAAGDALYVYQVATDTYTSGLIDLTWPIGGLLIAVGARLSGSVPPQQDESYRSPIFLPIVFSLLAMAVLAWDHYERVIPIALWLSEATIFAVLIRLVMSFRENDRLVDTLHSDAETDVLTGLGNRRALFAELKQVLGRPDGSSNPTLFALYDLDGFKFYNDSFGHPAGDSLLRRLGENASAVAGDDGCVFRLGGDEFCYLGPLDGRGPETVVERVRKALSERGEGFAVGASCGWAVLPDEAASASVALGLVDQRMYAEKANRSVRNAQQMQEIFMRIFKLHDPDLSSHFEGVARLAVDVGRELGLDAEELDVIARAAELHDIGKVAIPEEILHKPGRLDESEWELMRRHTLIGQRILSASPAMNPVGRLVRWSHERWDGGGYPDGLVGEETPIGARLICICDAFDAMVSERSYQPARSPEDALAELRACAGTQFDPALVELFCEIAERSPAAATGVAPAAAH